MEKLFKSDLEIALENLLAALKDYNKALVEAKHEADTVALLFMERLQKDQADLEAMTGDDKRFDDADSLIKDGESGEQ